LLRNEEIDQAEAVTTEYFKNHTHFKRWNGISIKYPSENYNIAFDELSALCAQGKDIQHYLRSLAALASEHRTGLTSSLRGMVIEFDKIQTEVERTLKQFVDYKNESEKDLNIPPVPQPEEQTAERTVHLER
jgi:hypothetical protein